MADIRPPVYSRPQECTCQGRGTSRIPWPRTLEFLSRTEPGRAVIVVEEVKLGRQLSTLHLSLYQHALLSHAPWFTLGSSRKEMVAYITCANIQTEEGISLPTSYALNPAPPAVDFASLDKNDGDDNWKRWGARSRDIRSTSTRNLRYYIPRQGPPSKSVVDCWLRFTCGEPFTNSSLTFVADSWPFIVESYRTKPGQQQAVEYFPPKQVFWYPTVVFNIELKKSIPEEGLDWLRLRVEAKRIQNGRLDLEMIIFDQAGEVVALSQHVNLVLDASRNTAKRIPKSNI